MQTLSPEVVYQRLVGAALRKSTITLADLLSYANDGFHVESVTPRLRAQVNTALCTCYAMDVNNGRMPLSALFVKETGQPGNRLRALMEAQKGSTFQSDADFIETWRNVCSRIYEQYDISSWS